MNDLTENTKKEIACNDQLTIQRFKVNTEVEKFREITHARSRRRRCYNFTWAIFSSCNSAHCISGHSNIIGFYREEYYIFLIWKVRWNVTLCDEWHKTFKNLPSWVDNRKLLKMSQPEVNNGIWITEVYHWCFTFYNFVWCLGKLTNGIAWWCTWEWRSNHGQTEPPFQQLPSYKQSSCQMG